MKTKLRQLNTTIKMRSILKNIIAFLILVCSCVSTSFHDEVTLEENFKPIKKMIVIVDLDDDKLRLKWERKIASQLRNKHVKAETSYETLKSKEDLSSAISAWKSKSYEGALLVRLDNIFSEQYEDFDRNQMAAEWTRYEANNERSMKYYYQRSAAKGNDKKLESSTVIVMYSRVFSLREDEPQLIWSAFSDSKNAVNMTELGNSFVAGLIKELKKSKLI